MASAEAQFAAAVDELIAKGEGVVATKFQDRYTPPSWRVDAGAFRAWATQSVSRLTTLLGADHTYTKGVAKVADGQNFLWQAEAVLEMLKAVRADLDEGLFTQLQTLVTADVFGDFLEMAEHLLDEGYKDPAAMLIGAVLEDGLRRILKNADPAAAIPEGIAKLNQALYPSVYGKMEMGQVQAWGFLRNHAAHGEFGRYSVPDVRLMLAGVRQFLANHLK